MTGKRKPKVRKTCSCGDPKRPGVVHMWLACWSVPNESESGEGQ